MGGYTMPTVDILPYFLVLVLSIAFFVSAVNERRSVERKLRHYEIIEKDIFKMFKLIRKRLNKLERRH